MPDSVLYQSYERFKDYRPPELGAKLRRRLDQEVWGPAACTPAMSFLEIGCGTGEFLLYLHAKGVSEFIGIDQDQALAGVMPDALRPHFVVAEVSAFLASAAGIRGFDRIALFDVLEHFGAADAVRLLQALGERLNPDGRIIVKVPNAESPWGARYQHGDLTHRTAFCAGSLRQAALAAGLLCERAYGQRRGSPFRLATDAALHWALSRILLTPPEIWSANLYAIFCSDSCRVRT
jgi:cyclopropane fatty-acyl-phospholipid synthase-like methyltransferase